ncbi:MAG: serine hydrolase domain-containing protein [Ignavibacteria bacterium]
MKEKILLIFLVNAFLFSSCNKENNPVSAYDNEFLNELVSKIEAGQYGEVHSLLISQNDTIVFEEYFNGYSRQDRHPMYSVTKSFTSAVMGICMDKGDIDSTGMKVLDFFPEYRGSIANYDSLKEIITIEHLLTMTAGFTWDELSTSYNDPDNYVAGFVQSSDWIKYVLDLPMSYAPGRHTTYNSGVSHVLSGIISRASGRSSAQTALENIFTKLTFENWSWDSRPGNISIGGWGLSIRPIDMVKFGQLYLHKGKWGNEQIISESWIEQSIKPFSQINYYCDYGYQWWRYGQNSGLKSTGIFFAAGRGEQFIWVIPGYNAVAVCTGWNDNQSKLEPVLWEYILPALENLK